MDKCAALLSEMGATIVRGPAEDTWAPGYYSVLFEDPDGIRLEVNFVPGAGDAARYQDPDEQVSDSLKIMENNGHLQCLMRGVKDYYEKHASTINILER